MKKILLFLLLQGLVMPGFVSSAFSNFRVVGYLPTWSSGYPNNINNLALTKLTHINIAFGNPNSSGDIIMSDGGASEIATVVNAAHLQNVKVFVSLGGWGSPGSIYGSLIKNNLTNFVNKIVQFVVNNNLDGIDIDIEGDALDGSIVTDSQYASFISQLTTGIHGQSKLISTAVGQWYASHISNATLALFDFVSLMSYDECIPANCSSTGACQHSPYSLATNDFQYFNGTKNVTASNINIGVPFYGYCWGSYCTANGTDITYCDIVTKYPGAENNDMVGSGNNAIYYNGIPTMKQKTNYALQNAGGVMIWELSQDCNNGKSLLNAINEVIITTDVDESDNSANLMTWNIFPNPSNKMITIEINNFKFINCDLLILGVTGEEIYKFQILNPKSQIDINNLTNGIYFVKLITDKTVEVQKIIKE